MPVLNRLIRLRIISLFAACSLSMIIAGTLCSENRTLLPMSTPALAEETDAQELNEEEQRQQLILDRYLSILERNPQLGTAFDRVYSMSVEQGKLDQLTDKYRQKVTDAPENGAAWKILGMIESRRGQEAEAIRSYKKAEELLPEDASVSYYLGQAYLIQSLSDEAIQAFERAIDRKPPRHELLEVYQALGKVYQRLQKNEEALKVWERLDQEFPDSQRVQEQIATTLMEEGNHAEALKRYQQMVGSTTDDYRRVSYSMKVAELQLKLGEREAGLAQFEELMSNLNPSSWLYRQVRDSIEEIFLNRGDQAGLTLYYQKWIEKNPRDIDALDRLSRILFRQDRDEEAEKMLREAIKLAPSDTALRNTLITQLIQSRKNSEAIAEYEALNEIEPNNPETIRDWGLLIVLDRSLEKEERQQRAAAVWKRLLDDRGDDPVIVAQVADWFREAEMEEQAIDLYQQAIKLAPDNAQYREYLGEYYHHLKRSEDALKTWEELVQGENRTTRNLIRLAEVLRGFGYLEEGLAYMQEACEDDVEFADRLNYARMLMDEQQTEQALGELDRAESLAENEEERHNILQERIRAYRLADQLTGKIDQLVADLNEESQQTPDNWTKLALYYEAEGKADEAYRAIREALQFDDLKLTTLSVAGRLAQTVGDLGTAIEVQQRMLAVDRKSRPDYLRELSQLEMQRGNHDQAIEYANDLITAAPGNLEGYQYYANLCFEVGREEEGFKTLRKAVRLSPNDQDVLYALANALSRFYHSEEAIELYWNAVDKAEDLESVLQAVDQLTGLYQRMGAVDKLFERLQSRLQSRTDQRELKIALAQAYRKTITSPKHAKNYPVCWKQKLLIHIFWKSSSRFLKRRTISNWR
ncbi:MAG: tetratricopeptide repeat protein [Planctomycetaceae bacterium]